ncbi:MAG: hypothetical protein KZQ83_17705 [gamma proteobacterium symbiont of Taylorina sp.]|nr:hypothetical protein [gamma proteobacterium symbiont of Taylorina sp.]
MTIQHAVYDAADICKLFDCGINEIPNLIQTKTIPQPLPGKPRGKRRWSKHVVNKKLGIQTPTPLTAVVSTDEIENMVTQVCKNVMRHGFYNV